MKNIGYSEEEIGKIMELWKAYGKRAPVIRILSGMGIRISDGKLKEVITNHQN
jgi:hypothetical protein